LKLVIAMIQDQDASKLLKALTKQGYSTTKLASTGGFLHQGNTTLLIGVEREKVSEVIAIIKETCRTRKQLIAPLASEGRSLEVYMPAPIEVAVGGATVFVMAIEEFVKV